MCWSAHAALHSFYNFIEKRVHYDSDMQIAYTLSMLKIVYHIFKTKYITNTQ